MIQPEETLSETRFGTVSGPIRAALLCQAELEHVIENTIEIYISKCNEGSDTFFVLPPKN